MMKREGDTLGACRGKEKRRASASSRLSVESRTLGLEGKRKRETDTAQSG